MLLITNEISFINLLPTQILCQFAPRLINLLLDLLAFKVYRYCSRKAKGSRYNRWGKNTDSLEAKTWVVTYPLGPLESPFYTGVFK